MHAPSFWYIVRSCRKIAPAACCAALAAFSLSYAGAQGISQASLPDAPSIALLRTGDFAASHPAAAMVDSQAEGISEPGSFSESVPAADAAQDAAARQAAQQSDSRPQTVGADGKPIRPQTGRIFGILPNFVSISGGTKPKPAGWKTDLGIANRQSYDYSSFGFLLISSSLAYAQTSHASLNTVDGGNAILWAYVWRGFLDKTDGSYQGSFFFPALLHEDTRYFALGTGSPKKRLLHAALSVVVAHNYDQKPIFNAAGLLGKVGAQAVSTTYYPAGSEGFGVLAEKFSYACLRQAIFAIIREYSPEAQARVHFSQKVDKTNP